MTRFARQLATIPFLLGVLAATARAAEPVIPAANEADLQRVDIRRAPKGRYAMYGGLTKLADGEILCVFKVGSLDPKTGSPWTVRDETIVALRSSGGGRTWPAGETVIHQDRATRQENCCGTGYRAKDGRLLHPFYILNADYEETAQPQNWSRVHLAESPDGGRTWSIRRLEVPLAIAASFGGLLRLDDGTLLLNVYGARQRGTFRHEAGLLRSRDDGRTWGDYTTIGAKADPDGGPARLNETSVAQLADGRLVSMSRTQYAGYPLYRGVSADRGRTWTVGPSGLTGLCPAVCHTRSGPAGVLAVVYHDRWGQHKSKGGVYATSSADAGATWAEPVWLDHGAYPCVLELEPGRLMVSYYRGSTQLSAVRLRVPVAAAK